MKKVLIFIVSFNAENFIESVLARIPREAWNNDKFSLEILIIDDKSSDRTFHTAHQSVSALKIPNTTILTNPVNQGYGGNQKIGYHYAIENGFDAVLLLHGDGQYPPEYFLQMIEPLLAGEAEVVFGSRMLHKSEALKGRMPIFRWLGNLALTALQNCMLSTHLSEFHTGYRAYSIESLAKVPFELNSNYYDFDTDIIIQMIDTGQRIKEIPIPTFYGKEISRVNLLKYGLLILKATLSSRICKLGIFYQPKFDYQQGNTHYTGKFGYASSHQFALDRVKQDSTVLDLGSGPGVMAEALSRQGATTVSLDIDIQPLVSACAGRTIEADVEKYDFSLCSEHFDAILLLDILEHLKSPESLLRHLRTCYSAQRPQFIVTTGNVAFLPIRLSLAFGMFNYGRRGILDLDHTRLFTFGSLRRLFKSHGYRILECKGIPVPFPLAFGDSMFARILLKINMALIYLSKTLFAYQIALVAQPDPTLKQLLIEAKETSECLIEKQ